MPATVLLLHAFPLDREQWTDQLRALGDAHYPTIAPNLPGFGGAPGVFTTLGDAADHVLTQLPDQPVDAVGLSMGGYVLMELLRRAPQRIRRCVFASTTAQPDPPERREQREQQARRVLIDGVGFMIAEARETHTHPVTVDRTTRMIDRASPEGVANALRAMAARPDSRPDLKNLSKPTLAIGGDRDEITPPDRLQEIAQLTGGQHVTLPGAGHLCNLDASEEFTEAILDFLRD